MLKNKFSLYTILLLLILLVGSCSSKRNEYCIQGKLENVKDTIFLAAREMGDSIAIDTIRVNSKGEFKFKGVVDTLTVVSMYFKESGVSPYLLVDKGWNVEVKGDIKYPDLILAKGGSINDDLTKFKNDNKDLLVSRSEILSRHGSEASEGVDTLMNKEYIVDLKNINFELMNIASEYVKKNTTKIASVMIINSFFKNEESLERLSESLDILKGRAYDFPLTTHLRAYRDYIRNSAVGAFAPMFSMKDMDGKLISLDDYHGKYVLLNFGSTTCGVCQEVLPIVKNEYDTLKNQKMNIEFISILKDVEEVPLTKENRKGVKWVTIPETGGWSSQVFEDYNIKELPYSILISKDGRILERNLPYFNLKNRLERYPDMKEKPKESSKRN